MPIEYVFWGDIFLWIICGLAGCFETAGSPRQRWIGWGNVIFPVIAIVLLGLKVFGDAIK